MTDGKEKAATATRAFWFPFAYRDKGDASDSELGELALQAGAIEQYAKGRWRRFKKFKHCVHPSKKSRLVALAPNRREV